MVTFMKVILGGAVRLCLARTMFVLASLAAFQCSAQSQLKIGTVDMVKVFDGYYKTKQADALLESHGADAQKTYTQFLEDLKKANEEYKKLIDGANDQAVSAEERDKRKKGAENKLVEIRDIEKSINQYRSQAVASITETKKRMMNDIVRQIREVVDAKARAGSYTFVFDTSFKGASDTPVVLYSNGQNDLTQEILTEMNKNAPPGILDGAGTASPKEEKPPINPFPKTDEKEPATPAKPKKR